MYTLDCVNYKKVVGVLNLTFMDVFFFLKSSFLVEMMTFFINLGFCLTQVCTL